MDHDIIIQVIISITTILGVLIPLMVKGRKRDENIKTIDRKLTTNHGKEAREYLELIADVHDDVQDLKASVRDVKAEQRDAKEEHAALCKELTDHTASDSTNFAAIMEELKGPS
jgi:peptidoglycan hydrolase CwlO-like protein